MSRVRLPLAKKQIFLLLGGVIVVGLVVGTSAWAMTTDKGVVIATPDTKSQQARPLRTLNGTYISFNYSPVYNLKVVPAADNDYEVYNLLAYTNFEKSLAVSVSKLDGRSLDNFTPYSARKLRSDLYSQQQLTVDGRPATMFIKKDMSERTVFIPRRDKVAVLSFVTTSSSDNVAKEITALLSSFHWKQ